MPFFELGKLPEREVVPGYRATFVHGEHMTLAYWNIKAGAALPEHSHPHEQVLSMIEGEFEFTLGGERRVVRPGAVVSIPSGVSHAGRAITDCRIIDAFYPVREDYRQPAAT